MYIDYSNLNDIDILRLYSEKEIDNVKKSSTPFYNVGTIFAFSNEECNVIFNEDLTNKKVLMCGYGSHRAVAQEVVDAHHGKELLMYDEKVSGKGMAGSLLTAVKHADIVIVMLNSVSHHTANQAISIARDQNKLVSATNTNSPLAIEEAIDRAMKREPIYLPTSHVIE